VSLAADLDRIQSELPSGWSRAVVELDVGDEELERAASFLAPAQPYRSAPGKLRFTVSSDGSALTTNAIKRLVTRIDGAGISGTAAVVSTAAAPAAAAKSAPRTLAQAWDAALATVPPDWSDLVGEIDLLSSDYLDLGALQLAPVNPRLVPHTLTLRFRCARRFGYGASPGMVRRCLERCDGKAIRGNVRIVHVLSDTRPVATQGPVWLMGGRTV
jgi:hypothetical protein